MTNWLTTSEAAALLGRSPRAVQHLIKRGLLEATRFGRDWQVSRASVEAWRKSHEGQEKRGRKAMADRFEAEYQQILDEAAATDDVPVFHWGTRAWQHLEPMTEVTPNGAYRGPEAYVYVGKMHNQHVSGGHRYGSQAVGIWVTGHVGWGRVADEMVHADSQWDPTARNRIGQLGASRDVYPNDAKLNAAIERVRRATQTKRNQRRLELRRTVAVVLGKGALRDYNYDRMTQDDIQNIHALINHAYPNVILTVDWDDSNTVSIAAGPDIAASTIEWIRRIVVREAHANEAAVIVAA